MIKVFEAVSCPPNESRKVVRLWPTRPALGFFKPRPELARLCRNRDELVQNLLSVPLSFLSVSGALIDASLPLIITLEAGPYAILESQIRIQVIAAGFDPTIEFLHSGRRGRSDFVLDLMEPLRPIVDRKVLEFVRAHTFHSADFTIRPDGVCRLNPEMARKIASLISGSAITHRPMLATLLSAQMAELLHFFWKFSSRYIEDTPLFHARLSR